MAPPMSLYIDNGLPCIELWFDNNEENTVGFICHVDTCAVMNTGNLEVHK